LTAEFDFRMNTRAKLKISDAQRTGLAVRGAAGKRLQYKSANQGETLSDH
jgi:hypothetical protein